MGFQIGDKVRVVDEDVRGVVTEVFPERVVVYTDFGFEAHYTSRELVFDEALEFKHGLWDCGESAAAESVQGARDSRRKANKKHKEPAEVDLHIEKLVDLPGALTRAQMLEIQKSKAIEKLEEALEKGIPKLIFIHGVGEGILRSALHDIFRHYTHLSFYDASYARYGRGATEVEILGASRLR